MLASESISKQVASVHEGAAVPGVVLKGGVIHTADTFWEKSICRRLLLSDVIRRWRVFVRRLCKINNAIKAKRVMRERKLNFTVLSAWKKNFSVSRIQKRLEQRRGRRLIGKVLDCWLAVYVKYAHLIPSIKHAIQYSSMRKALLAFRVAFELRKRNISVRKRQDISIALFCSVRVFRAWQHLALRTRQKTQNLVEVLRLSSLKRHLLQWKGVAQLIATKQTSKATAVFMLKSRFHLARSLKIWLNLYQYRSKLFVRHVTRKAFLRFLGRLARHSRQKRTICVDCIILRRGRMGSALWRWLSFARKQRSTLVLCRKLAASRSFRALRDGFGRWLFLHRKSQQLYRSARVVYRAVRSNYMHTYFAKWSDASLRNKKQSYDIDKLGSETVSAYFYSVSSARNRWLRLFEKSVTDGQIPQNRSFNIAQAKESPRNSICRAGVRRRVLDRLGETEFMYWDSDSESDMDVRFDEGEVEDTKHVQNEVASRLHDRFRTNRKVFVRHYIKRWSCRIKARRMLKKRSTAVQLRSSLTVLQSCFRYLISQWIRAVRSKYWRCAGRLTDIQNVVENKDDECEQYHSTGYLTSLFSFFFLFLNLANFKFCVSCPPG